MRKRYLITTIPMLFSFASLSFCLNANELPQKYLGTWTSVSKACIADSTLTITKDSIVRHYESAKDVETYQYLETNHAYPKNNYSVMPDDNPRHVLKITQSEYNIPNRLNLTFVSTFFDTSEYSMYKPDHPLLAIWQHDYKDREHYLEKKKEAKSASSWCLYKR